MRTSGAMAAPAAAAAPVVDEHHLVQRAGAAVDLKMVARRCGLKAESCLWAITRRVRLAERADFNTAIKPTDDDLLERARALPQCHVWALDPYGAQPPDDKLELAANCYQNLADAAALTHEIREQAPEGALRDESYSVLAEGQSALRVLIESFGLKADLDQEEAFQWLKTRTFEDQVYLTHYMRWNDPGAPSGWMRLAQRIAELRSRHEQSRSREREQKQWFSKARYHARRLADQPEFEAQANWQTLISSLEHLVALGLPPSNTQIRELLLPIIDNLPEGVSGGDAWEQVAAEVDRYIASREPERPETASQRAPTPELRRAAAMLQGKVVVLIGGQCRPHSQRALERDLELAELRWLSSRPHQSISEFEPDVARPETALVLLAIRWASHSFEGVAEMCVKYGKPFVRLPRGYGSNQVAAEIVSQVGGIG
jgi:hypothetical protein